MCHTHSQCNDVEASVFSKCFLRFIFIYYHYYSFIQVFFSDDYSEPITDDKITLESTPEMNRDEPDNNIARRESKVSVESEDEEEGFG